MSAIARCILYIDEGAVDSDTFCSALFRVLHSTVLLTLTHVKAPHDYDCMIKIRAFRVDYAFPRGFQSSPSHDSAHFMDRLLIIPARTPALVPFQLNFFREGRRPGRALGPALPVDRH
ncbi:hypothetical protein DOTSEDRAFT_72944 [Dothistroma septosporum NZE10]|uniref:Uncharacterized protein n=1 Tax=Dothistroma septosporum (strain NZE10 / CBS 128990) TaxID=675120 RepID=N1PL22_DOTSN|nr:hypothetical protein DOTSEDRAFT_72944 [Dothistroma septosporum NZE10]